MKWSESHSVVSNSLRSHGLYSPRNSLGHSNVFPFSRGSSQPTDRTHVFHIAGGLFTSWVTREAQFFRGAHNSGLHSNPTPYTQQHLLWIKTAFGVVGSGSFCLPHHPFNSTLLSSIHFSSPITICFKNRKFLLHLSTESHAEIWSGKYFSAYVEGSESKESAHNAGDPGSIPESERSPEEGNGNTLQYSCLENPMDRVACRATVQGGHKESDTPEWLILSIPFKWSTWLGSILQWEISGTKVCKPLWTCSMSHSTFSIQCTNLCVCVCVSVAFWPT